MAEHGHPHGGSEERPRQCQASTENQPRLIPSILPSYLKKNSKHEKFFETHDNFMVCSFVKSGGPVLRSTAGEARGTHALSRETVGRIECLV